MVRLEAEGRDFKTSGVQIHGFSWYVPRLHDTNHLSVHTHTHTMIFGGSSFHRGQMMLCPNKYITGSSTNFKFSGRFKVSSR